MESEEKKQRLWNRTFICAVLCQALMTTSSAIANPLITTYTNFLGADAMTVGFLTGMLFGVANLMRPFSGPAIVRFDKRHLLIFSAVLGIVFNVVYAVFNNISMFVVARVLQGIQFSIIGSLIMTIVGDNIPKEKLGSGIGIYSIAGTVATAVGPSIGLALNAFGKARYGEAFGFKAIFYASAALFVVSLIPAFLIDPQKTSRKQIAAAGVWYRNIISPPAIPLALCMMFNFIAYSIPNTYMVPYAAEKGFAGVGTFFTIYAAFTLVTRPVSGKIVDRFGASSIIYPSVFLYIASFLMLWKAQSMTAVYISAVLSSLGFGASFPVFQSLCLQVVPRIKRGAASNTVFIGIDIGQFFGPIIGGTLISAYATTGHAYSTLFLLGVVPIIISAAIYAAFRKYLVRKIREAEEHGE